MDLFLKQQEDHLAEFIADSRKCNHAVLRFLLQPSSLFRWHMWSALSASGNGRVSHRSLRGRKDLGPKGFINRVKGSVEGPEYRPADLCICKLLLATGYQAEN